MPSRFHKFQLQNMQQYHYIKVNLNCWGSASVKLKHLAKFKYFTGLEQFTLLTLPYFKVSSYQLLCKDYWKTQLSVMLTL